jgi:hypothetical protein
LKESVMIILASNSLMFAAVAQDRIYLTELQMATKTTKPAKTTKAGAGKK